MMRILAPALAMFLLASCSGKAESTGRAPEIHDKPGAMYETVFKIPVGEEGVSYRGLNVPEMQVTGPNALAVGADGSFFVADLIDNRLLHYSPDGKLIKKVDLSALGITNVSDMVSTESELYLLEISLNAAPERYRVSRLSFEGVLIAQYDIPNGYRFEDGLYGLAAPGSQGEILLELLAPKQRYYQLADPKDGDSGDVAGIPANGQIYQVEPEEPGKPPAIRAGTLRVESRMTMGGLLRVLAVNPDGTFYVIREDMVADLPVIQGDITIHFLSSEGEQLGAARYPLAEWLYFVQRHVAIGPDGNAYGLLPRRESVDVVTLNYYLRLEPLIPGAAEPLVSRLE